MPRSPFDRPPIPRPHWAPHASDCFDDSLVDREPSRPVAVFDALTALSPPEIGMLPIGNIPNRLRRTPLVPPPPIPSDQIWRAVADRARRAMIDIIFHEERITQDVVDLFPTLHRCTVMKHLRVLEAAGIVKAMRHGPIRFHTIRLAPLFRIHDEWLGGYASEHEWRETRRLERLEAEASAGSSR